jgi:hypothetical protein
MKTKPDPTATSAPAVRLATLKVAKLRRIVEAEEKLAHAAKVRFKGAKKTWKLARKTAKRSAKKLKQAEKKLASLGKQRKHDKAKAQALPAKASRPAPKRRRPAAANSSVIAAVTTQPPAMAAKQSPQD